MWEALAQEAAKAGIWVLLAVALIYWNLTENRKRELENRAEAKQREERLIAESKTREERFLSEAKQREVAYADREDRYLAIIQTLGEEVKERLTSLERTVQNAHGERVR